MASQTAAPIPLLCSEVHFPSGDLPLFSILDLDSVKVRNETDMAKLLLKFQRYFRRKPIRFFTFIALYLTAGSLVFLHAGFSGETRVPGTASRTSNDAAEGTEPQYLGTLQTGREFKAMPESLVFARRYGAWFKSPPKDAAGRSRGDYGETWSRVLKGRNVHEKEEDRAKYIGCYVDNTHQRALRGVSFFD